MNDLIKNLKSSWVLASMSLLSLSVNYIYAQQTNARDAFIERINTAFNRKTLKNLIVSSMCLNKRPGL